MKRTLSAEDLENYVNPNKFRIILNQNISQQRKLHQNKSDNNGEQSMISELSLMTLDQTEVYDKKKLTRINRQEIDEEQDIEVTESAAPSQAPHNEKYNRAI